MLRGDSTFAIGGGVRDDSKNIAEKDVEGLFGTATVDSVHRKSGYASLIAQDAAVVEDEEDTERTAEKTKSRCCSTSNRNSRAGSSSPVGVDDKNEFLHSERRVLSTSSSKRRLRNSARVDEVLRITPDRYELLAVIGRGAYGRVLQARDLVSDKIVAVKVLPKGLVLSRRSTFYIREERNILSKCDHPFVVSLICAFQTEDKLFLVMEYLAGGELFAFIRNEGLLNDAQARFYSGEMILAIEYLHQNNIIHRDLKPENVLLDRDGHVRITDFGLAKVSRHDDETPRTLCGTDLYMAPEMISEKSTGYGKGVDYWSLGVIIYEMLTGDTPFYCKDTRKLYAMILSRKVRFPPWISSEAVSLLKGLLNRNVEQRLGVALSTPFKSRGVYELKNHAFYKGLDWNRLEKLEIDPPFIPLLMGGAQDTSCFNPGVTQLSVSAVYQTDAMRYEKHLENEREEDFQGFSFTRPGYLEAAMKAVNKPENS